MTIREHKLQLKETTRKEILRVAREIAKSEGWANVSTRKIAKEIEYSTTKLYEEFGSREAILLAVQHIGFGELKDAFLKARGTSSNPPVQLMLLSMAMWDFAHTSPELYEVMFRWNSIEASSEIADIAQSRNLIEEVIAYISPEPSQELFIHWWALMHGLIALAIGSEERRTIVDEATVKNSIVRFIKSIS